MVSVDVIQLDGVDVNTLSIQNTRPQGKVTTDAKIQLNYIFLFSGSAIFGNLPFQLEIFSE